MGASKADGELRAAMVRVGAAGTAAEVVATFQFDQLPINLAAQGVEPGRYYLVVTNSAVGTSSIRTALCFGESSDTLSCLPEDSTVGEGESEQVQETPDTGCTQSHMTELWGLCVVWLVIRRSRFKLQLVHK